MLSRGRVFKKREFKMYEMIHFDFSAFPDKYMGCRNRTLKYPSERSKQYNVFSKIKYIVFSKLKSDVTFQ